MELLVDLMETSRAVLSVASDADDCATGGEDMPDDITSFDELSEIEDVELEQEPRINVLYKNRQTRPMTGI